MTRRRWPALAAGVAAAYWTTMWPHSQLLGRFAYRGSGADRTVALTFDDGPNEPYTSQIADFLAERGVRATFFSVGRCVERHPQTTLRLARDGHVIASHGLSHQFHKGWGRGAQQAEIERTQQIIAGLIGRAPALYRPPWLIRTPGLFKVLRANSLIPISGDFCHAFEFVQPASRRIARRALAKVRPGAILIFHDGFDSRGGNRSQTVEAVKAFVDKLIARKYRFTTVDELLEIPAYQRETLS